MHNSKISVSYKKVLHWIMISSILDIRIYSAMTVFKSTCISIQVIHLKALDSISWKWKVEQASLTGRACCQSLEVCKSLSRSIHYFLCHILDLLLLSVHCPINIVAQEAGVQEGLQYSENKSFTSRRAHTRSPLGLRTNECSSSPSLHHPAAN